MITQEELIKSGWEHNTIYDNYSKGNYWDIELLPKYNKVSITEEGSCYYYGLCRNIEDLLKIEELLEII